jgi:UDP-N-acetylmuramate: L-alanyl-gamma-D-glutamyl-meso-diaminopimelate ligase
MNFSQSARLGDKPFFVIEADEYDTAFFDKRSKFVHYRPRTVVLNNLEFDHADIFDSLDDIKTQFHHLVRTVPANGRILVNKADPNLDDVIDRGCWSEIELLVDDSGWSAKPLKADCSEFSISFDGVVQGTVEWNLIGEHNMHNALAAVAATRHAGVAPAQAIEFLGQFKNVKRRLEIRFQQNGIVVYDDFAHHPTEIAATLSALRNKVGEARIIAILEPRSNTMRMGVHQQALPGALAKADEILVYQSEGLIWDPAKVLQTSGKIDCFDEIEKIVDAVEKNSKTGDHIVVMSNGGFGGIHARLAESLSTREQNRIAQ